MRRKQKSLSFAASPIEYPLTHKMPDFMFHVSASFLLAKSGDFASQDSVTTQKCSSKLGISFAAPESRFLRVGCTKINLALIRRHLGRD